MLAKSLLITIGLLASNMAMAHARLKPGSATPPRNDSTGLKTAECGGPAVPRTATPKTYRPGEEITVEWEETINHPGYFVIRFSESGDTKFEDHVLVEKFIDNQNGSISGPSGYHQFSTKIKFPNVSCDACTLQLIQVMEENPQSPSKYFSCSDIKLVADKPTSPAPTPQPTTTPTPTPVPTPTASSSQKPSKPTGVKVEKAK